jgi:hypothetical protein
MDNSNVSELAEELAQVTCGHLPCSDQRMIALELGVGECDLALEVVEVRYDHMEGQRLRHTAQFNR